MQVAQNIFVVDEITYEETKNSESEDRISSLCTVESVHQQEKQKLSSLTNNNETKHDRNNNSTQKIEMYGKEEIITSKRQIEQVDHLNTKMNESVSKGKSIRQQKQINSSFGQHGGIRISLESDGKEPETTLFEKKRARFRVVKDWEDKRIQKTSIFASIFNEVGDNLTKIATQSNDFIENVLFFFKDTQIQLAQLAKAAPCQIEEAFRYSPHIGNISYPAIHRVLRSVAEVDQTASKNASDFSKFIEQSIMRNYLISDKKNFTSVFSAFTILLKEKKAKIAKLEKIAVSGYEQYSELFKQMILLQTKGKDTKKDFYYQELIYMHHVNEHLENLRDFGLQVVRFTEELEQLQRKRLQSVQQALELYLTKRKELMESLESNDIAQEMLNSMEMGLENTKLEMGTLLMPEQVNYIRQCYRCEELNIQILKQFAQDFALRNSSEKTLVLKELSAQQPLEGKTNTEYADCSLIFTIDKYLIIAAGMLDSFGKPSAVIFLPNSKISFSKDTLLLTLTEVHKHVCWNSKKSYYFKLEHEFDAKEITALLSQEQPQQL